jgi:hypothetical protein
VLDDVLLMIAGLVRIERSSVDPVARKFATKILDDVKECAEFVRLARAVSVANDEERTN